jgi:hypothetical protein
MPKEIKSGPTSERIETNVSITLYNEFKSICDKAGISEAQALRDLVQLYTKHGHAKLKMLLENQVPKTNMVLPENATQKDRAIKILSESDLFLVVSGTGNDECTLSVQGNNVDISELLAGAMMEQQALSDIFLAASLTSLLERMEK